MANVHFTVRMVFVIFIKNMEKGICVKHVGLIPDLFLNTKTFIRSVWLLRVRQYWIFYGMRGIQKFKRKYFMNPRKK